MIEKPRNAIAYFSPPGLLPPGQVLALNQALRIAVLYQAESEQPFVAMVQFSPQAFLLFQRALDAFPQCCAFEELLQSLSPALARRLLQGHVAEGSKSWVQLMRPVYKAARKATEGLLSFGLELHSVRSMGYKIGPARSSLSLGEPPSLARLSCARRGTHRGTDER